MKELYIANNFLLGFHDYSVAIIYDKKVYCIELDKYLSIKGYDGQLRFHEKNRLYKIVVDILKDFIGDEKNLKNISIYNINYFGGNLDFETDIKNHEIFDHHLLHACSTYYPSHFDQSAILIIDDYGGNNQQQFESQTMWYGENTQIKKLYSNCGKTIESVSGIGRAYTNYSLLIGLEEGSVMGLSAYGDKKIYENIELFKFEGDNVYFDEKIDLEKLYKITQNDYLEKESDITKSKFADIAAHLQQKVEEAIVYLANRLYEKTNCKNLCLAGGVALNILANTKILEQTPFENIFVQPATNDGGLSLGAAYYGYHVLGKNDERIRLISPGLGKSFSDLEIEDTFKKYSQYIEYKKLDDIEFQTAKLLNDGKIVGWFEGKNEYGPRALGFRSILASPKSLETRDKVNQIKNRQKWRPLAPVILEEKIGDYFSLNMASPYMTFSSEVLKDKQQEIKGVVHVDNTSRFQSVNKDENIKYYNLLKEYYNISNTPVLINTSFNVSGQAIVYNIQQATETFLSGQLDYLVIEDYLVSKKQIYKKFEFQAKQKINELLNINQKDKESYFKNWDYLKRIFFNDFQEPKFCYGDNEDEYNYTINKFCFDLNAGLKIIIEKINDNSSYFQTVNDIGIKFDNKNIDLNQKQKLHLTKIISTLEKHYEKIKILFGINK